VDKLWADWQKLKPENKAAYKGPNGCRGCALAGPDDILAGYNVKVSDVFDTAVLCYQYEEANIAVIPQAGTAPKPALVRRTSPPRPVIDALPPKKPEGTSSGPVKVTPYDDKVTSLPAPKDKEAGYVPDDDRENLNYIRVPDPLTEEWLKLNSLDVTQCRKTEAYVRNETIYLNRVPGYVSPNALWNRPELVERFYTPGAKFYVELNGIRVIATSEDTDGQKAYGKIKERVEKSVNVKVQLPISEISTKVAALIGPPLISDMNSMLNPYAPRYKGDKGVSKEKIEELTKHLPEITKSIEKVTEKAVERINAIAKESANYKKELRSGTNDIRKSVIADTVKQAGKNVADLFKMIKH